MESLKVLLVEDSEIYRMGLSFFLQNSPDFEVVGEAGDGKTAVEMALSTNPNVVLMDIGLPDMDGIQATAKIKKINPNIKILIFTSRDADNDVFDALSAGADGYIMKGTLNNQLEMAIKAVADGTAWLDPAIARLVLSNVRKDNAPVVNQQPNSANNPAKNIYGLTEREIQVLGLIVEGCDNIEISKRLVVTLSTAKAHVHNILQKLYVKNRTQATMQAVKEGLV